MVWNATSMPNIPDIYTGHLLHNIYPPLGTTEIIKYIVDATSAHNYTQTQSSQDTLTGTFIQKDDLPPGLNSNAWIAEAEYQHSDSYPTLLDVPALLNVFSSKTPRERARAASR